MLALDEICEELKLVYMNISDNQGGIESAKFIARNMSLAREVVAIEARYNSMPVESIPVISSGLRALKGKMEHLDLSGNYFVDRLIDYMPLMAEFQAHGSFSLQLSGSAARNVPYDDDPYLLQRAVVCCVAWPCIYHAGESTFATLELGREEHIKKYGGGVFCGILIL